MSSISFKHNRRLSYPILLMFAGLLTGCTTIPSTKLCTPTEQRQLKRQLLATQSLIDRKEAELSRSRKDAAEDHCVGSLLTPAVKSARCTKLLVRTKRLATETKILRERLNELDLALVGRTSPSKHVKSCKASWVASPQKPQSKIVHVPQRKPKAIAQSHVKMASAIVRPVYEIPTPIEAEKVDYTPSSTVPISTAPVYVAPAAITPPLERPYTANAKVRVVGSEFFPDQSALTSRLVPVHEAVP